MSRLPPASLIPFTKPWLDYARQLTLLESRGLTVADRATAEAFLSHVNYYRFSGYGLAFEQSRHKYIAGTTFEQVRQAYEFDLHIRDLLNEALEVIEVDLRTALAYSFGQQHGAFGHTQATAFLPSFRHADWLRKMREEMQRSQERFVIHFKNTYQEFPDLPIWVATEVMSFGALSMMYKWMRKVDQGAVSSRYGLQPDTLQSWMHHLVYVRNLCAHHARLWDRIWSIKPKLPAGKAWGKKQLSGNDRLACTLLILYRMLRRCPAIGNFALDWKTRVNLQIASPPASPNALFHLGMSIPLNANDLWK